MTRLETIQKYVNEVFDQENLELIPVSGDASFRKYYRIENNSKSYIVMDSPPDKEPPEQFIRVSKFLNASNINVPTIYFENEQDGILIIKDFGDINYLESLNEQTAHSLYCEALNELIELQQKPVSIDLPAYDRTLLLREINLFKEWLLEQMLDVTLSSIEIDQLTVINEILISNALEQKQVFVHRDYHSRNLMVVDENNPGIIDYQDAVIGPITYDLVSILKDCYIKWPLDNINQWCEYYFSNSNLTKEMSFDSFMRQFHLMGVQRHLKASGIFARLKIRDNKPNYIADIPRTLSYITDLSDIEEIRPLIKLIETKVNPWLESI